MNTPAQKRRRPPQISLSLMMLMMVVFAIISAGLFYASQVPAVQDEISGLMGSELQGGEDIGRTAHITFIMFTFTSPLILAGLLSTGVTVSRWYQRETQGRETQGRETQGRETQGRET